MAVCPDCNVDVGSGKELTAHRKKKHGVQQVICPYCVGVNKHSNPSALARHVKDKHPTAKVELFGSRLAYYFAVRPEAYGSITQPETITDNALVAKETLERWASQTGGEAAEEIFINAKQDWRKNMKRTVEQGADIEPSSKRPAKATSVPMAVPENEQLSLLTLNLGSRRSLAEIGWYGHGIYRVELGVGDVRSLARKLMELKEPKRVLLGQPCQEARDRATLKVIASVLGIASYKSIKRACLHSQAAVRVNSMGQKATDAEWGNVRGEPSLIPAHPDSDSDDDTEEWSGDVELQFLQLMRLWYLPVRPNHARRSVSPQPLQLRNLRQRRPPFHWSLSTVNFPRADQESSFLASQPTFPCVIQQSPCHTRSCTCPRTGQQPV